MFGMMNRREGSFRWPLIFFGLYFFFINTVHAQQLFINEIQSSNVTTIVDHTGDTPDWIELFNAGSTGINLKEYGLSDVDSLPLKWKFPSVVIAPQSFLLVYASGLDLKEPDLYWQTIIDIGDNWKYMVPAVELSPSWKNQGFNDDNWPEGKSGFGYGDNDDSTILNATVSVFIRKQFSIENKDDIDVAYLHMDYDDGFVAYINGFEIARSGIGQAGLSPPFDQPANEVGHEAQMYFGGSPEEFLIDSVYQYLVNGENILAIQIHNSNIYSSDLTAIPIFTIGKKSDPGVSMDISKFINLVPVGLHTNFKIASEGEHIVLSDPNGIQLDSIFTNYIPADISLGRSPDGSKSWAFFGEPTPGQSNTTLSFSPEQVDSVYFSIPGGFYQNSQQLELSTNNGSDSIYYTLDGSEPTLDDALYSSTLGLLKTTTIRARVMKSRHLPGAISTAAFFINETKNLPVVSITTDPYNLWDNDYGIYVKGSNASAEIPNFGANFWEDWERPANITMYEVDGSLAFQLDAGIKIFGAWSRANAQKSLSIHMRKAYGKDRIYYKLFEDKAINEFQTFILRNSGNDFNSTMFRDALCNEIMKDLELDYQAYRPAVVYINGAYWGIQNIREKVNEEFLAANHRVDENDVDILEKSGEVVKGNSDEYEQFIGYINSHNLAIQQNYEYVKTQIDVSNFIKYQIAEIFIDNRDWPGNNIKYWKERGPAGKWRWILFDSDFGLNIWSDNNQTFNTLHFALEPNGPDWPNPPWSTLLFRKLMENKSFKNDFINCFADNLNTIFRFDETEKLLNSMKSGIESEITRHLQRWNGDKGYWDSRIAAMRTFLREREGYVRNHIKSEFQLTGTYDLNVDVEGQGQIQINTLRLNQFPWQGIYFINIPVNIVALPDPGYKFVGWKGINTGEREQLRVDANESTALIAVFEPAEVQLNDVIINEINYNSSLEYDAGDWVELLNITDYAINISGWMISDDDENTFTIPDQTVIQSHGFLVICRDKEKFTTQFPQIETIAGEMDFGFSSNGDCIQLYSAQDKLIDEVCYENDTPWPTEANGDGSTLSLVNALSNNEHPSNWEASINLGTPGRPNDVVTGMEEIEMSSQTGNARIYPNPVEKTATIALYSDTSDNLTVSLMDLSGRKTLLVQNFNLSIGSNEINLQLDHQIRWIPGVYFVLLSTKNWQQQIKIILHP